MFTYTVVAKVVTDEGLYTPTGPFGRWAASVRAELQAAGTAKAPLNRRPNKTRGALPIGSLKASVRAEMQRVTLRRFNITLSADTPYAKYVHEGTNRIYARGPGGKFGTAIGGMRLPGNPGYAPRWRQSVRGQSANPFLKKAWNEVHHRHSGITSFIAL